MPASFVFPFVQVDHLFPAMFAKEKVKKGEIKEEDVPVRPAAYVRILPSQLPRILFR